MIHWHGIRGRGLPGRNGAWRSEQIPGVEVRHCGHPTALRPYYVEGLGLACRGTFPRLAEAQAAAEAVARAAGRIVTPQPAPLELSPCPPGRPGKCNKRRD